MCYFNPNSPFCSSFYRKSRHSVHIALLKNWLTTGTNWHFFAKVASFLICPIVHNEKQYRKHTTITQILLLFFTMSVANLKNRKSERKRTICVLYTNHSSTYNIIKLTLTQ